MFKIAYRQVADVSPFVYLPGEEGLTLGMAAALKAGSLAACGTAEKPTHILMGPQREDGEYPAIEINDNVIFETMAEGTVAQTLTGTAVQLTADALGVTPTAGGAFRITHTDGETDGSTVQGVFVEPDSATV